MTENERGAFGVAMAALCASFRIDPSEALLEGYWLGLSDLEIGGVRHAAMRAIRECQHMPRPAELRKLTGEMGAEDRAVRAWSALKGAIGQHGAYSSVDFDDPVLNATVRNLGGWQRVCSMPTEEFEKWTRRDFDRIYAALMQHGITEEQAKHLPGIHERENSARGFAHMLEGPRRVATGLPPHRGGLVREISAFERLALSEKTGPSARVIDVDEGADPSGDPVEMAQ